MYQRGTESSTGESGDRGVSPQVGIILLFGLVIVGASLIFLVGATALEAFQTQASAERGEQMMLEFDNDLQTALLDDGTSGSVYLEEDGNYEMLTDGQIEITAENKYANKSARIELGTLRYEDSAGNVFAHQAGGVWQGEGDESRVVTDPNIQYAKQGDKGRVDFSVTNLEGNITTGENRVVERPESTVKGNLSRDIGFVNYVEIEVTGTSYHNAWANFLQDEFDASSRTDCNVDDNPGETIICHDEPAESVTVIAPIEGENPFASHVGIDPTIYGGLYVDDSSLSIDESITVDRYNSSEEYDADNVTEDLLVANGGLHLDSNVTGVPVVNGELSGDDGADTSSIAFATRPDGDRIDVINGTEVYNVTETNPPEVFGAKLSRSFSDIDSINRQTDRALDLIESYEDTAPVPSGALGAPADESRFYYSNTDTTIDDNINTANNGSVHVAVDGDLDLDDVTVTGNGNAYFYVSGDITAESVDISGDDARRLWIYGTSGADVTVGKSGSASDEFQGVIYAPNSDSLTLEENTEVFGAIVGGNVDSIGKNVNVHFDKGLRTDIPIPEENRDVQVKYEETRVPIDVTFVLDRSGSMGYTTENIEGNDWHVPEYMGEFRLKEGSSYTLQIGESENYRTVSPGERNVITMGEKVRVDGEDKEFPDSCFFNPFDSCEPDVDIITDESGNDPLGYRITAAKSFIGQLNETDRAGAVEFNTGANRLHEPGLDSDFKAVNESLVANFGGGTYMKEGIEKADSLYQTGYNSKEVMILLTDGKNEVSNVEDPRQETLQAVDSSHATIYTIGLGEGADEGLLKDIANETGGRYEHVSNAENLSDIFKGIASNISAESPATFEVASMEEPMKSPNDYSVNVRARAVRIGS